MTAKQRIMLLRLQERIKKNPEYTQKIGIEVCWNRNKEKKAGEEK